MYHLYSFVLMKSPFFFGPVKNLQLRQRSWMIRDMINLWFCRNQTTYQLGWSSASVSKFMTPKIVLAGLLISREVI